MGDATERLSLDEQGNLDLDRRRGAFRIHSGLESSFPWHPQREQMQGTRGIGGSHVTRRAAFALPAVGSFTSELQFQCDRILKERISNLIINKRFTKLIGVDLKKRKNKS